MSQLFFLEVSYIFEEIFKNVPKSKHTVSMRSIPCLFTSVTEFKVLQCDTDDS